MGKLVQRQALTPKQYKRANMAMMVILILCYITYIVVEITNMGKPTTTPGGLLRCGIYAALLVLVVGMYIKRGHEKLCMLTFAVSFLIGYAILVFNNGAIVMILIFPALLGFMIYLNSVVVSLGIGATMIICVIKTISISNSGNTELLGYASLIIAGFFVCIYGSIRSILILIEFSREDRAVIEEEAANRAKVAQTVAEIAEKMDSDFRDMLDNLNTVNNAMASADSAMTNITNSTENTADAVDSQANSTNRIHANLETTNDLAAGANEVTERLNAIIRDGKSLSDQLQMQSDLVDQNISNISDTVDELVRNVQKVHGITESILNISSQTNLLALNASIEAARAGNAGRGFAVVADEIRKLAEETKTSTEQITAIISELTAVTSKTQAGIMASTNSINEQRQKVKEVNTSFTNVEVGMEELKESVLVITSNVQALLEANTEIVDSIQLLSEASQNVSSGTQTCKDTIETAVENLERFSDNVNDTFEQLQVLRETATS